jgi:hypothetical protein
VGSLAIDMLAARGYQVVALTGKQDSSAYLRDLGAARVLLRQEVAQQVAMGTKPLEEGRWAGAIDNIGGDVLAWLTRTTNPWGNIASVGMAASFELKTTVLPFILRGVNLLGINSVITAVSAPVLRDRVKRGDCDLWIGQISAPIASATAWWGGGFAAGGDLWAEQRLATGALDRDEAIKAFGDRLPILPLVFRAVRIWHRTDVRGLGFDATGRPDLADLFYAGDPAKPPKAKP